MGRVLPMFALLLATTCYDPLPRSVQWLAGRWQWTGSCCSIAGQPDVPDSADTLVMLVHHNGDATIIRDGTDTVRTRVYVDTRSGDPLATFDYPLIYNRTKFRITRVATDSLQLEDFPPVCVDCPAVHGFARVP